MKCDENIKLEYITGDEGRKGDAIEAGGQRKQGANFGFGLRDFDL